MSYFPAPLEQLLQEHSELWESTDTTNSEQREAAAARSSVMQAGEGCGIQAGVFRLEELDTQLCTPTLSNDPQAVIKMLQFEKATMQHTVQVQRGHCDQLVQLMAKMASGEQSNDNDTQAALDTVSMADFQAQETELTELRSELLCTKKVASLQEEYCSRLLQVAQDAESRLSSVSADLSKVKSKAKKRLLSDKKQLQQQQQEIQKLTRALLERDANYRTQPQLANTPRLTVPEMPAVSSGPALPEALNKRIEDNARHMVKAAVASKRRSGKEQTRKAQRSWKASSSANGAVSPNVRTMIQEHYYA